MKYKILLLLSIITQIAFAQTESEKIIKGIKMGFYINDNTEEDIIKEYGTDYRTKAKSIIDELTPYNSVNDINIRGGANIAITQLNYSLVVKTYEADKSASNTKILGDLNLLKKSVETALIASARNYKEISYHPKMQFSSIKGTREFDYIIVVNTCRLLRYYYGSNSPNYLETIGKVLEHIVARSTERKKDETYYESEYFNFFEQYDLIAELYNQIDAQKFNKKTNEELKRHIKMCLPWLNSKEIADQKFENTKHFLRYYEAITKREEISGKEDSVNHVTYTSFSYSDAINALHTLEYRFYTLNNKEPTDKETKEWFYESVNHYYNYYIDRYDAITAKKKYADCYNPEAINYAYAPEFTLKNIKTFDINFQKKYVNSLLNTLRFAAVNNKKWEDRFNSSYGAMLKSLLNALLYYYTNEKDDANITRVNNCLTILKEEPANSGEVREALMAL
jgi:hypothetical protein